ncbi:hypothetical protein RB195_003632 [Necator americanus]
MFVKKNSKNFIHYFKTKANITLKPDEDYDDHDDHDDDDDDDHEKEKEGGDRNDESTAYNNDNVDFAS